MSTIVMLHAHPDDEASSTGGTIAKASQAGHRVVVVYATNGEHGESPDDLAPGESVVDRRRVEAAASARVLGTARVEWLGYEDSGMTGWEGNQNPTSFHQADLDEAGGRLARILDEEDADVVVGYDWHGNYGHPDHVKVHPVVYRAAALAARRPRVLEATMNRDANRELFAQLQAEGAEARRAEPSLEGPSLEEPSLEEPAASGEDQQQGFDPDGPGDDGNGLGMPEAQLHFRVDTSAQADLKKQALQCHASQATDVGALTGMPDEVFRKMFAHEYFREHGRPNGMVDVDLPF